MDCSTPGLPVLHQLPESLKLMSIESVMPSNHLILCCPLLLLPPIPSSLDLYNSEYIGLNMIWSSVTIQFSSVQLLSHFQLFVTPWTAVRQASLSITNSWGPLKPMSIVLVMPSNHLILYHPVLLLPSIFPSIMVFSNESALHMRWPKYWSFSFNISPFNEHPGLISFRRWRV